MIGQWADEIGKISEHFSIRIYYGGRLKIDKTSGVQKISGILQKGNKIFDGSEQNSKVVVLTSYKTFLSRHGPTTYKNHLINGLLSDDTFATKSAARAYVEKNIFNPMPQDPDPVWE